MFDDIIQRKRLLRARWTIELAQDLKTLYEFNKVEIIEFTTIREEGKGTLINTIRGNE